jgi:excisionase family DNA binding protein
VALPEQVDRWLTIPDVAELMGLGVTRVRELLREGGIPFLRAEPTGPVYIPADLVTDVGPVKHVGAVLTLLRDAGYSEDEQMRWLFTPDPTIPGTPAQALRENRGTEIKRRAQALGF